MSSIQTITKATKLVETLFFISLGFQFVYYNFIYVPFPINIAYVLVVLYFSLHTVRSFLLKSKLKTVVNLLLTGLFTFGITLL